MAPVDIEKIRSVYTAPYYLSLPDHLDDAELEQFIQIAKAADLNEVLWMLSTEEWRCRKAGAWFTLVRDEPEVDEALRLSLLTSRGSLTSPDLGVCLVQRIGAAALPLLLEHQSTGIRDNHGPQGVIAALITSLGGASLVDDTSELDDARMAQMQQMAKRISER